MKRTETLARVLVFAACLIVVGVPVAAHYAGHSQVIHARMAENGGWTPQVIQAKAGEPLTLHLTSDDVMHGFAVGQMDMQPVDVEPGKVTDVTLTFNKPGTYTFYCTRWCGLNHWRMRGTIEVFGEPATTEPPQQPLYVALGINIDAPHPADVTHASKPSAAEGARVVASIPPDLQRLLSNKDYYRSHSPAQAFAELKDTVLTDQQKWDVVAHAWRSNTTPEGLAEGQRLFAQNCAACHGQKGAGDGVFADQLAAAGERSMQGMTGTADMPIQRPANFTDPIRILGASPALLQGKLLRGGMGTGMPMWGAIFTDEQTWNIIAFLYSFQFDYPP